MKQLFIILVATILFSCSQEQNKVLVPTYGDVEYERMELEPRHFKFPEWQIIYKDMPLPRGEHYYGRFIQGKPSVLILADSVFMTESGAFVAKNSKGESIYDVTHYLENRNVHPFNLIDTPTPICK